MEAKAEDTPVMPPNIPPSPPPSTISDLSLYISESESGIMVPLDAPHSPHSLVDPHPPVEVAGPSIEVPVLNNGTSNSKKSHKSKHTKVSKRRSLRILKKKKDEERKNPKPKPRRSFRLIARKKKMDEETKKEKQRQNPLRRITRSLTRK